MNLTAGKAAHMNYVRVKINGQIYRMNYGDDAIMPNHASTDYFSISCCVCKSIVQESGNSLMECNTCQNLYHQVQIMVEFDNTEFPWNAVASHPRCVTTPQ